MKLSLGALISLSLFCGTEAIAAAPGEGDVIYSFFTAANAWNAQALENLFSDDAYFRIPGAEFRGKDKVMAFLSRDVRGGRYDFEARFPVRQQEELWVRFTPGGASRPEPPISYAFTTAAGKITGIDGRYRKPEEKPEALVPTGFTAYLRGVAAKDPDLVLQGFSPDPLVVDVGRQIAGRTALRVWLVREVMGLTYRVLSVELSPGTALVKVRIVLPGGGDFIADYLLTTDADGLIRKADLTYGRLVF